MVNEFLSAIIEGRDSEVDAEIAANWTGSGVCAHESALRDGERIYIPVFG